MLRCPKCGEIMPVGCPECDRISFTPTSLRRVMAALRPELKLLLKYIEEETEHLKKTTRRRRA